VHNGGRRRIGYSQHAGQVTVAVALQAPPAAWSVMLTATRGSECCGTSTRATNQQLIFARKTGLRAPMQAPPRE